MIPFSFQKGNKAAGCEDAPPVANTRYAIVCDGLGGAGATKHFVSDGDEAPTNYTSGYLGSRIVSSCVDGYYNLYYESMDSIFEETNECDKNYNVNVFLCKLKDMIVNAFANKMEKYGITPSRSRTLKDFPTTLVSTIYFPTPKGCKVMAVWAGDSRAYILTPTKGLQLLSLDDAKNAENEMNSASEMTNCISAGNSFNLNYAFYELEEPGIIFCCSDGCFDYLQSPLHFEWLLLHTILECMPECSDEELGDVLAASIRDNVYKTIGDDTTMVGLIVGINSREQLKELYQSRVAETDNYAVSMNDYLKGLKMVQNDRDTAQKTCRLNEDKIQTTIHDEVCRVLAGESSNRLMRSKIEAMLSYYKYLDKEKALQKEMDDKCIAELQQLEDAAYSVKNVCRSMLLCDYMKKQRQAEEQGVGTQTLWGSFQKNRTQNKGGSLYAKPERAKQTIYSCIEMFKHIDFKEIATLPMFPGDEVDKCIKSQVEQLEVLINILESSDEMFTDLWSQAYFSTKTFTKERYQCDHSPEFELLFEQAIKNPNSCDFASPLTKRKIMEYCKQGNGINAIREKYENERQQKQRMLREEFWLENKDSIINVIMSDGKEGLQVMFGGADVQMERLVSYSQAKKTLSEINNRLEAAQMLVDKVWNAYKVDYQLFAQIKEKGVC